MGSIIRGGVAYFDVVPFLEHIDAWFASPTGGGAATFNPATGFLAIDDQGIGALAGLDTTTGTVEVGAYGQNGNSYKEIGTASPIVQGGRVYLSIPDRG